MAVFVKASDGSFSYTVEHWQGLQVGHILQDLQSEGRKGYLVLESTGLRLTSARPAVPGETYVFVVEVVISPDPWFLQHDKVPSPSSLANSLHQMKRFLGTEDPIYDLGRTSSCETPLPLVVEAFGLYITHSRSHVMNARDWNFVEQMMGMSQFYDDENLRQLDFGRFLEEYLVSSFPNFIFRVSKSPRRQKEPDVLVEVAIDGLEWVPVAIAEVKPELGHNGEPCVESMKYFADYVVQASKKRHWLYQSSCCPVLIIEIVGPTMRVGGAAFLEKPSHQPFTPYLHILGFLEDGDHLEVVSRALGSIRIAIASLVESYMNLKVEIKGKELTNRDTSISWPYFIRNEQRSSSAYVVRYVRQLTRSAMQRMHVGSQKKLVFYLRYPDGKERVVKFCQRYGDKVHLQWAQAGYAPEFHHSVLPGSWVVINMEFYSEVDGWLPLTGLDPRMRIDADDEGNKYRLQTDEWEKCKSEVRKASENVHALNPACVHGDMRRHNILYNVKNSRVAFVDFDWSGIHGQDMYPFSLNPLNTWPSGVKRCEVMKTEHDAQLLDIEFEP